MTEQEARAWLEARNVPRETFSAIERFLAFLKVEAASQNLIAASTIDALWARHVVDSAQLLDHAPHWESWLDLGAGPGTASWAAAKLFPSLEKIVLWEKSEEMVKLGRSLA